MVSNYYTDPYEKAKAVNPDSLLEEMKEEHPDFPYLVAFTRLSWVFREAMFAFGSTIRKLECTETELDLLQWSAEKVLNESEIKLGERETIYEYFYAGAEVIRDLRKLGWDDDKIREYKVTELEIENARHLIEADFCLNCDDRDSTGLVKEGEDLCSCCEDELVEVDAFGVPT